MYSEARQQGSVRACEYGVIRINFYGIRGSSLRVFSFAAVLLGYEVADKKQGSRISVLG